MPRVESHFWYAAPKTKYVTTDGYVLWKIVRIWIFYIHIVLFDTSYRMLDVHDNLLLFNSDFFFIQFRWYFFLNSVFSQFRFFFLFNGNCFINDTVRLKAHSHFGVILIKIYAICFFSVWFVIPLLFSHFNGSTFKTFASSKFY